MGTYKHEASSGTLRTVTAVWAMVMGTGIVYAFFQFFPHLNEGGLSLSEMVFMGCGIFGGIALVFPSRAKAMLADAIEAYKGWRSSKGSEA